LNHRSLTHDLEVEIVLNKKEWVDPLIEQWDTDLKQSHAVTIADLGRHTWLDRVIARFAYWFRYWL
jgi:cardiolipin synthase